MKGRFNWNRRTTESLKQAADFLKQAIEKDPHYALAYAGLAETYALFTAYSVGSTKDSMPQAKAAAQRALELDDSLAAPHATLGLYLIEYEWDRIGGEREFRAIELDPNYATARQWFATDVLAAAKRFDEALAELRRAEELDPLSPIIGTNLGNTLVNARAVMMRRWHNTNSRPKFCIRSPGFGRGLWLKRNVSGSHPRNAESI